MDQLLFDIFFWGVFVGSGTIFVFFTFIKAGKQYKRDIAKQKDANCNKETVPIEVHYDTVTIKATVVDQTCCVKTIGIKSPKTVKEFLIVFQTENDEIMKFYVPEEMYDGFAQGQTGILSIVDGELYSFDLEEVDSVI